jgi:hypothetical protein
MMILFIVTAVGTTNPPTRVALFAAFSSFIILRMFKLKMLRLKGYVAHMRKMRTAY